MIRIAARYAAILLCICSCSIVPDDPRPAPALEFLYGPESSRKLIVFVHGVLGDSLTWRNPSGKSWPELMEGDDAFRDYRIATYRYDSPLFGSTSTVQEVSNRMLQTLEGGDIFRKYNEIYFVTHSMGGIVTKRVLVSLNNRAGNEKLRLIKAMLYIATPAQGAEIADLGTWLSLNPQFRDVQSANSNSYLQNLEEEWVKLMQQRGEQQFPKAFCAYETKPFGSRVVVSRVSAITFCDETATAFDEHHVSIVKPRSRQSEIYEWARARIQNTRTLTRESASITSPEKRLEDLLKRNEFLQERSKEIDTATFLVQLKRLYKPDELGHFRVLLEVSGEGKEKPGPATLSFAARDAYTTMLNKERQPRQRDGLLMRVWSKNPDLVFPRLVYAGLSSISSNIALITVSQDIKRNGPFQTLESLARKGLNIFISESLADKVAVVGLAVNNYLLVALPIDCVEQIKRAPPEWPLALSPSEQAIGWLNLLPRRYWPEEKSPAGSFRPPLVIDFDRFTPERADSQGAYSISPDCELSKAEPLPPREEWFIK